MLFGVIPIIFLIITACDMVAIIPVDGIFGDDCEALKPMIYLWTISLALTIITAILYPFLDYLFG